MSTSFGRIRVEYQVYPPHPVFFLKECYAIDMPIHRTAKMTIRITTQGGTKSLPVTALRHRSHDENRVTIK
jgi:hypothetical protein